MNPRLLLSKPLGALALLGTLAFAPAAHAHLEARCPQGFNQIPPIANSSDTQHPIVACARPPVQIAALLIDEALPQNNPQALLQLVGQLLMPMGFPPGALTPNFREEQIGGQTIRIGDFRASGQSPEGATVNVEATVAFLPVGTSTLILRGFSSDANRGHPGPAVRGLVPALQGLDGSTPAWRASATCPNNLPPANAEAPPNNAMRRVALCGSEESGTQVDVMESRLPVRNAQEARLDGEFYTQLVQRVVVRQGGTVQMEEPTPFTIGTTTGFMISVHVAAPAPPGVPNAPPGGLRLEQLIVVIPTPIGHVQLLLNGVTSTAAQLQELARNFVQNNLRFDGSGATTSTVSDGGTPAPTANPSAPPAPRRRRIDPNVPLWQPSAEDRPTTLNATTNANQSTSSGPCGCRTPGQAKRSSTMSLLLALFALRAIGDRRKK